jgi:hypothetical protein
MKKFVAFSMGALMALSFSACSNDDDLDVDAQEIQQNTESSYISVRITGSNFSSTRAEDSDFVDGTGDETESGKVDQVQFFFFDKDGKFISKGNVFQSPDFKAESSSANIEKYGEAVVEIDNFDSDNKPALMVTLLNAPTLEGVATDGTKKTITDLLDHVYDGNEAYQNSSKHFIMATSSYKDETAGANNTYYYATKLSSDCFQNAGAFDSSKAVDVYVERLAAKVTLDLTSLNRFHSDTKLMYLGKFKVTGMTGDDNGYTKLYAKIEGWGLNATAQHSYMLKHLDTTWTKETLGFDWNDASRYRSYWGESYNYGRDGQGTVSGTVPFPEYYGDQTVDKYTLKYWSANELKNIAFDATGNEYCFENTNTGAIISSNHVPATATCILIKAQLTDENENVLSDIVKFHGGYYTRDAAMEVIVNRALAGKGDFHKAGDSAAKLSVNDVEWTNDAYLNGHLTLKLKDGEVWEDGTGTDDVSDHIDSLFAGYTSNEEGGYPCISYKAGMYYYAPINHLNYTNTKGTADTDTNATYAEGYYGVVRNHVYQVIVNGFKQLDDPDKVPDPSKPNNGDGDEDDPTKDPTNPGGNGDDDDDDDEPNIDPGHGIEDPDEPIVPNPDEDSNWYLSTQINILSWRIVNQYVKI